MFPRSPRLNIVSGYGALVVACVIANPLVVLAASFDCQKAQSKMEKTICSAPQLSALDERLGTAYKAARGALSPEAAKELAGGQSSWLKFYSQSCFVDREAAPAAAEDATSCLKNAYDARIARLEETGKVVAGFKTYWVVDSAFKAFPESKSVGVMEREYMQVDDASPLATSINGALGRDPAKKAAITEEEAGTSNSVSVSLESLSPDILAIRSRYDSDMGGTHGDNGVNFAYFSKGLNRVVTFGDLFASEGWKSVAARISQQTLAKAQLEPLYDPASVFDSVKQTDPFGYYMEGKSGFTVDRVFLSYAERGEDVVSLPWTAFADILTSYAKDQIALFTPLAP